jgi:hypothetical protein
MGIPLSKLSNKKDIYNKLDLIATEYIFTQSFQDMLLLQDKDYCDKMIILTSDIISQHLNQQQIEYFDGKLIKDNVIWSTTVNYNKTMDSKIPKKQLCIGLAKRYIQIAQLFGSIITTINPTYTYNDHDNIPVHVSLKDKHTIPQGVHLKVKHLNLCSARINALINHTDLNTDVISVNPMFCNINNNDDGSLKTLSDEPGIGELEKLYNDVYNHATGKYIGMSTTMKALYDKDVNDMYITFTGHLQKPDHVKNFRDIKLRDYSKSKGCTSKSNVYNKTYKGSSTLFIQYANHIKNTIKSVQKNQELLSDILDVLFIINTNDKISINPTLTDVKLTNLVSNTRKLIISIYSECEDNFTTGLELFEAIVEKQLMIVTKSQIEQLDHNIHTILVDPNNVPFRRDLISPEHSAL